jgi:hypothetical protein
MIIPPLLYSCPYQLATVSELLMAATHDNNCLSSQLVAMLHNISMDHIENTNYMNLFCCFVTCTLEMYKETSHEEMHVFLFVSSRDRMTTDGVLIGNRIYWTLLDS